MRVLFVDDEPRVLQGLRRGLHVHGAQWNVSYADGGPAAIAHLEAAPFDAVVTDMQMSPMNGADLLYVVRERWPATLRYVLSGQVDTRSAVRALQVAQQLLAKPCDVGIIVSAVENGIGLQRRLDSPIVRAALGKMTTLPAAPQAYAAISHALSDPRCDARRIASLIERDPALTGKVLQLANSAFFRNGGKTSSDVAQALTRIGLTTLADLVLASEIFSDEDPRTVELRESSLRASRLAVRIAGARYDSVTSGTAALLADIGYLLPGIDDVDTGADPHGLSPHAHAELGASLLGLWLLPMAIVEAVAHHHAPPWRPNEGFGPIGIVHAAVALVTGLEPDEAYLDRHGVLDLLPKWKSIHDELLSGYP